MNQTALKIVRDWYRTSDPAFLSPEIEWRVLESFPSGGLYRGRDDVVERFFPSVKTNFASYETCPADFLADGEAWRVLTVGLCRRTQAFWFYGKSSNALASPSGWWVAPRIRVRKIRLSTARRYDPVPYADDRRRL